MLVTLYQNQTKENCLKLDMYRTSTGSMSITHDLHKSFDFVRATAVYYSPLCTKHIIVLHGCVIVNLL